MSWPVEQVSTQGSSKARKRDRVVTPLHAPVQSALVPAISVPCGSGRDGLPVGCRSSPRACMTGRCSRWRSGRKRRSRLAARASARSAMQLTEILIVVAVAFVVAVAIRVIRARQAARNRGPAPYP